MPMREKRHVRLRNGWVLVLLSLTAAASLLAFVLARRSALTRQPAQHASALLQPRSPGYADPALCITCHEDVALPYSLTGMGRSFSRVDGSRFATEARVFHHEASNRYYTMVQRGGALYSGVIKSASTATGPTCSSSRRNTSSGLAITRARSPS